MTATITVPATTANLGPGFDCIGAALALYNQFKFTRLDLPDSVPVSITVTGKEANLVNTDASNLVYQAFVKFYQVLDQTPPLVQIDIRLDVPLARGLGSSATAIVAGLVGANCLAGEPLDRTKLMELAIALEGHPDNVVPAMLGGCRLAVSKEGNEPPSRQDRQGERLSWEICEVPWHRSVVPVVAIPDFELETKAARRVLPAQVSRADAIFNMAHLGLLVRGLEMGRGDWLRTALQDRLHQPYRQALIPGYEAVYSAAMAAGALGMVISGAGPTLLAMVDVAHSAAVEVAMATAWQDAGIMASVRSLSIDTLGVRSCS